MLVEQKHWKAICTGCSAGFPGGFSPGYYPKKEPLEKDLKKANWCKIGNKWFCHSCARTGKAYFNASIQLGTDNNEQETEE